MDIQILVVEDDENIANAVKAFLIEAGYRADICYNGDEALTRFYGISSRRLPTSSKRLLRQQRLSLRE